MPKKGSKPTPFEMVGEFHETFGHPVHTNPIIPDVERQRLRGMLMVEELAELIETLYEHSDKADFLKSAVQRIRSAKVMIEKAPRYEFNPDIEHLAKEMADSIYVTNGSGHEFGLNLDLAAGEVHRSNMSKADPETGKPIYDANNKVLKGSAFSKADMGAVLDLSEFRKDKGNAA